MWCAPRRARVAGFTSSITTRNPKISTIVRADRLALHFGPDRKRPLAPAIDMRGHAVLCRFWRAALDLADQVAVCAPRARRAVASTTRKLRIERAERESSSSSRISCMPMGGERRIDIERLLGDPVARGGGYEFQRAHVVQAVGKLDQENADVVGDRQQQLAQVLGCLASRDTSSSRFNLVRPSTRAPISWPKT